MVNKTLKYNRLLSNASMKNQAEVGSRCPQIRERTVLETGNQKSGPLEFGPRQNEENCSHRTARKDDYQCDHPSLSIQSTVRID